MFRLYRAIKQVLIVRPDDGLIGPKHVAFYVLLMVIVDVLDKNINTLFKKKGYFYLFTSLRSLEHFSKRVFPVSLVCVSTE
jgi:hypothetical protein